jgi:hypothetical protein
LVEVMDSIEDGEIEVSEMERANGRDHRVMANELRRKVNRLTEEYE